MNTVRHPLLPLACCASGPLLLGGGSEEAVRLNIWTA